MIKRFFGILAIVVLLSVPLVSRAESPAKEDVIPSRESLLSYWEKATRENPSVKRLEKTGEEGVYNFETTLFPYKGRVKVLNVLIEKYSYYDADYAYEKSVSYKGIVETDLMDAAPDFSKKYEYSFASWQRLNRFYYDGKTSEWFPENMWQEHFASQKAVASSTCPRTAAHGTGYDVWMDALVPWAPLVLFLVFIVWLARRQNRRVWDNQAKVMERQLDSIKLAEDGMVIQREHTQLLKDILSALEKK